MHVVFSVIHTLESNLQCSTKTTSMLVAVHGPHFAFVKILFFIIDERHLDIVLPTFSLNCVFSLKLYFKIRRSRIMHL